MPPTYRDSVRPALIETGPLDTGSADAARALADAFSQFGRQGADMLGELRRAQGRQEGAAAGRTGAPGFRQGMASLTAYGAAYNDSALRSYAIKSESDADEAAARLEVEAGTDVEKFRNTFGAVGKEALKAAPAEARAVLTEVYDRRLGAGLARLSAARATELREDSRAVTQEGIARAVDRIAQLRASNDPDDHVEAEGEALKLQLLIDGAQGDGTLTSTEAAVAHVDAERQVVAQTVMHRFKGELDNPYGDPIGFIERLREANKTSEALPPDEEEKLMNAVLQELAERSALESRARSAMNAAQQARWDAGNQQATSLLLGGQLSASRLRSMVDNDELDPNRATALHNELTNGSTPKSVAEVLFDYETNLLSYSEEDISTAQGLTWDDRSRLILKRREWASGWRGTQEGREAADRIDRALGIPPGWEGKLLSGPEKTKRERALTAWYNAVDALDEDQRQVSAIPTVEEVIQKIIKSTANDKLDRMRARRAELEREYAAKGELSAAQAKYRDQDLAAIDSQIRQLEQQAR